MKRLPSFVALFLLLCLLFSLCACGGTGNTPGGTDDIEPDASEPTSAELIANTLTRAGEQVQVNLTATHKGEAPASLTLTLFDAEGNALDSKTVAFSAGTTDYALTCGEGRANDEMTLLISATDEGAETVYDTATLKLKNGLPQLTADGVRCVVAAMTLEEKAHLVTGTQSEKIENATGSTYAIERLGIPATTFADGPAGVRYGTSVWYPSIMNLASSWDAALVARVGQASGEDGLGKGFDIILSPGMNIQKNPLCGRNFEYFSEDPLLTGYLAAAYTNGMQSTGVGVSLKHFAVNNLESSRTTVSANLTERALREIYLRGFDIALKESAPYTVMSSYNRLNGTYTAARGDLLNGILRGELGFDGMVMSDWGAGGSMIEKLNAGNDLNMPGNATDPADVIEGYGAGLISDLALNAACRNILGMVVKTPTFRGLEMGGGVDFAASRTVSENAAADTMVLLKNEGGTLPLSAATSVAVYGNGAVRTVYGGGGSGGVTPVETTSIMDGIRKSEKLSVYEYASNPFLGCASHSAHNPALDVAVTEKKATADAAGADVALIVISRSSEEGWDRTNAEGDFRLNATEREMIARVSAAFHAEGKKVVVLLNTASPIEVVSWRESVDAILWVGYAGEQTGRAVEKVLTGEVNPSAKLTCTWPGDYTTVPDYHYFPGSAENVYYYDDIYVGYRYYDTFGVEVAYPFGFGLSYTTFAYSGFSVEKNADGSLTARVTVTNTGAVAGREVVQCYLSKPETTQEQAAHELAGFQKTGLLAPGASETVTVTVSLEALKTYDTAGSRWIIDRGDYTLSVGSSLSLLLDQKTVEYSTTATIQDTESHCAPEEEFDYITKATYKLPAVGEKINLAYGKEAWSNHSEGNDAAGASYEASRAVDGDFVTRWSGWGLGAGTHLWQVDLGDVYEIGEIVTRWQSLPVPFTVLVSLDGVTFTEVGMYTPTRSLVVSLNLYGERARFIRLDIPRGNAISMYEFMAYEATEEDIAKKEEISARENIALGKRVTSTACEGAYMASYAVDGSTTTRWSAVPGGEAWLRVDLGKLYSISALELFMESSWQPYLIEYSVDGSVYTTLASCAEGQLWASLSGLDIEARYIRVRRVGEEWFSIIELKVYQ